MQSHQYVDRASGAVVDETLFADRVVRFLYSRQREDPGWLFRELVGPRSSSLLACLCFDLRLRRHLVGNRAFLRACGVRLEECADAPATLDTPRRVFERRLRYWTCRPMAEDPGAVVSPADAKVLVGDLSPGQPLFLKGKFFDLDELLGVGKTAWQRAFARGQTAIFRLTPDKYHYNHTPVAGRIEDIYEVDGLYHSCNPTAVVQAVTPYSKNKRVVTVFQTDVPGGTGVGLVAMIEVVALMIGGISQCYSEERYETPTALSPGMLVRKGQPKSLYHPGSSTDILLFEPGRVRFAPDLLRNARRADARSRFAALLGGSWVETEVPVRSLIAQRSALPARGRAAEPAPGFGAGPPPWR
jgi:phosphatidylserine decarboxylase